MKIKNSIVLLAACAVVITFSGCSKSETPTLGGTSTTNAVDATKDMMGKATDTAKDVAGQAVAAATNLVSGATAQFAEGVASAKKFIAEKNYQGALDELKKLSSLQLSAEQQKVVDGLKDEAAKLLSGGATDAAKNLLK